MKKVLSLALVVPMIFLGGCGVEIVDAGHTGVKKVLGEIKEETYPPGFYLVNPFTTNIIHMDNRVKRSDGELKAYTKDVQQAVIAYTINYNLEGSASSDILNTVGWQYEEKLIPPAIRGGLKDIIGEWNAIELVSNRVKAGEQIEEAIATELSQNGISVKNLELTDIKFTGEFENAVEAKVTAVQRAEEAKNNTVRVEEEAKQRIIAAEADAKAMGIKTQALARSQSLILYEAVQKWDGILPKIVGGDGGTLLNIPEGVVK